jgi:hypothetical protein
MQSKTQGACINLKNEWRKEQGYYYPHVYHSFFEKPHHSTVIEPIALSECFLSQKRLFGPCQVRRLLCKIVKNRGKPGTRQSHSKSCRPQVFERAILSPGNRTRPFQTRFHVFHCGEREISLLQWLPSSGILGGALHFIENHLSGRANNVRLVSWVPVTRRRGETRRHNLAPTNSYPPGRDQPSSYRRWSQ